MLLENRQVAIIGGGPGGLTLARLLQQEGANVKVYERDADQNVRPQGSSLDLHYHTGLKAIEAAGLLDEFKKQYRPGADKTIIVNSQMDVLFDEPVNRVKKNFGDERFRPEIDRGPLRDLLIGSLKKETLSWNSRFMEMKPSGTGWELLFETGTSAYADLVIAADGAKSKVRSYITDIPPVYSGITALEGNIYDAQKHVPTLWKLINGGSLTGLENGKIIFFITKSDGALTVMIPFKKPENWLANAGIDIKERSSVAAWFKDEFAEWSAGWEELFATDALSIVARPWYYFPPDQHWKALPNLTMIGDAAHLMPPNGEGANQAMADAMELCESLYSKEFDNLEQAIASFEQKMLQRCAPVYEQTLRLLEIMHAEDNLQVFMGLWEKHQE